MAKNFLMLIASIAISLNTFAEEASKDTIRRYQLHEEVVVTARSYKNVINTSSQTSAVTTLSGTNILQQGLKNPKHLSAVVPGLYMPDYGSAMTSTIYLRGFGSRIDNPVMGLYVDDVPIIDKNNYDFDFFDVSRIEVMRGPQSTLYGRNSMLGVMAIKTLEAPGLVYGESRKTVNVEYGKNNWVSAHASFIDNHFAFSAGYRHSDGYFKNDFNNDKVDKYDAFSFKGRYSAQLGRYATIDNTLTASLLKQGGYAYGLYEDGKVNNVNYNDTCTYRRFSLVDGLRFRYTTKKIELSSITSFQWLTDKMFLDNDFTAVDMFTMAQKQHQYAVTQDIILRPGTQAHPKWWNSQTGVFFMYKHNKMNAPVDLHQAALDKLILKEANSAMEAAGSPMRLAFSENNIPIRDDFKLLNTELALYHESYFYVNKHFTITAGLRLDYESSAMNYDCDASVSWLMNMVRQGMTVPVTKPSTVNTLYNGSLCRDYTQLLPKLALAYDIFTNRASANKLKFVASVSKGFKAGGYNTQIFSDILRTKLKSDMMADAHRPVTGDEITSDNTTYKPETCFNYEVGGRYSHNFGYGKVFTFNVTGYLVNSNDQQITVMPAGNSTGRIMTNAGKARSIGFEAEAGYIGNGWNLSSAFGYTNAYFRKYIDGDNDYSDNKVPYSPQSTLMVRAAKQFELAGNLLTIGVDGNQIGKIMWNEANTLHQNNYFLLNADLSYAINNLTIYGRAENITSTEYNTFYFKSVGNEFFQKGKPFQWTVGVSYKF